MSHLINLIQTFLKDLIFLLLHKAYNIQKDLLYKIHQNIKEIELVLKTQNNIKVFLFPDFLREILNKSSTQMLTVLFRWKILYRHFIQTLMNKNKIKMTKVLT